jgi:hypothetical protein
MDRRRILYGTYGMGRGRWSAIWGPATRWAYLQLVGRQSQRSSPPSDIANVCGRGEIGVVAEGIVLLTQRMDRLDAY